jgi:hypothetical protein
MHYGINVPFLNLNFQVQDITGIHVNLDVPKWLRILYLDRLNSFAGNNWSLDYSLSVLDVSMTSYLLT